MTSTPDSQLAVARQAGDRAETAVLDLVPELRYVADTEADHYDSIAEAVIEPSDQLPIYGVDVLDVGTQTEIKSAGVVYGERQRRGRFSIRRGQHNALLEMEGVYLFAVCAPHDRDVIAMCVMTASVVDDLRREHTDGWRSAGDGREDYVQLSWARVFDPSEVDA
ncbi:hypothetical protein [Natronorubrum halophilum]|uniref:hypothetical protein n=1 Tax=Natronorubrum halophilum TaxID=1702106 RepID=UPI000EF68ED4|nr:hypothetical protein [Natronorubrum halophilum]